CSLRGPALACRVWPGSPSMPAPDAALAAGTGGDPLAPRPAATSRRAWAASSGAGWLPGRCAACAAGLAGCEAAGDEAAAVAGWGGRVSAPVLPEASWASLPLPACCVVCAPGADAAGPDGWEASVLPLPAGGFRLSCP